MYFSDFGSFFWCCWLVSSKSRKHHVSRSWLPTTTAVGRTRRRHTPHQEWASLDFAVRGSLPGAVCSCPLVKCTHVQLGVVFCLVLCIPNFDHCSASTSRCGPLLRKPAETNLKRLTASVDEILSSTRYPSPKPRTSRSSKRSVLTEPCFYFCFPIKHTLVSRY